MKRNPTGSQQSITAFFKKPKVNVAECSRSCQESSDDIEPICPMVHTNEDEVAETSMPNNNVFIPNLFDISDVVGKHVDDLMKRNILTNILLPKEPHKYPLSSSTTHRRAFQSQWITHPQTGFPFLAYSVKQDGVYCKPCLLFFPLTVGKGCHEIPGKLVKSCFSDWKKARETFNYHVERRYHKDCVIMADNFLKISSGEQTNVALQLNVQEAKQRAENRAAIKPIIETILFCAEQELPLRGDEDSGPLTLERPKKKDGKFRALLRFRANAGDLQLKDQLASCSRNAMYTSPDIQNEIIQICSTLIVQQIVAKVENSIYFSLLADETMDVSGREQLSLCVRYVDEMESKAIVREDFLGFVKIHDQGAESLTKELLKKCEEMRLAMENCVGQGYDGATTMSGNTSGVQTRIREKYPSAKYFHCASHRLNLALSSSLGIPAIRNCLGTISEVVNIFRNQPYANHVLQQTIRTLMPESRKQRLIRLCETRFIERHDSLLTFTELFEPICISLEEVCQKKQGTGSILLAALEKSDFLIALLVCESLLSLTLHLSIALQGKTVDFISAMKNVSNIVEILKDKRLHADIEFNKIYTSAEKIMQKVFNNSLTIPRITGRQTTRSNLPLNNVEAYYRAAIFIPALDSMIVNLTERFEQNSDTLQAFQTLLPGFKTTKPEEDLEKLSTYFEQAASLSIVVAEYHLWHASLKDMSKDAEVLEVLENCNPVYFPTMHRLLKILVTLPVTTISVERSYSAMKRIKTSLRNRMGDDRLTGLGIISINWDFPVNPDQVIDVMATTKNRRIKL